MGSGRLGGRDRGVGVGLLLGQRGERARAEIDVAAGEARAGVLGVLGYVAQQHHAVGQRGDPLEAGLPAVLGDRPV